MKFGDLNVTLINGGNFRLDGGAMHGVVPKTIWSKFTSCDDRNRCSYSTNCLLVEGRGRRILIETGNGEKFSAKEKDIYGIEHDGSIEKSLRAHGIDPESIDLVVMTHLHFDHAGGTTKPNGTGGYDLVFPRARHVIQKGEYEDAMHAHERNRASYLPENIVPLMEAQKLDLVEGEQEIAPGVFTLPTPGHTAHHQSVRVEDGNGHSLVFLGDVMPTSVHLRLPFIMAYDLNVVDTLESKRMLVTRAEAEKWLFVFGHDIETPAAYVKKDDKGQFVVGEKVSL